MRLIALATAPFLLGAVASIFSSDNTDFHQPQSPPKPAPSWLVNQPKPGERATSLKLIDQGQYDPQLKGYITPEGLKVDIVADFPTVVNPVGMTFADDGTPYVLEWLPSDSPHFNEHPETITYKDGSQRTIATMKKRVKDVVKVLHASPKTGRYEKAEIILEDELPSSILLHDGWIYLSGRGTVRRYKQSKPGGPYDVRQVIAQGFCGYHHHQVSGMTIGNDGWLYITSGDDDNYVEGSDGSRATVLRTGVVFRCRPDGSRMHAFARGFRNPYRDVAFDTAFNIFHTDNDNEDGSKFMGCRLMHIAEGSDFGWRLFVGARCCRPDSVRGAIYGELPGKVPPLLKTGRGAPAGLLIYNDTRFPEHYRGLLLYPDVYRRLIRAYRVQPRGATFEITEEFEFMKASDDLFRPCQMVLGPDGAMYIVDWRTNSGGAGQLWGDGKHGRIYRVSWTGTPTFPALPLRGMDSWSKIGKMSNADLLKTLASPEFSDRQRAQREWVRRGQKHRPEMLTLLEDGDQPLRARIAALGAVQAFWDDTVEAAFLRLLKTNEADLRRLAADGLALNCKSGDKKAHHALVQTLGDPHLAVCRAVALAIGKIGAEGAADALVNALAFSDGKDVYAHDGLVRAIERLGPVGMERLLSLATSGVQKNLDKVVHVFAGLRTRPGVTALPLLLSNPHLSTSQRVLLLQSYGNYLLDPPISIDTALDYLLHCPKEAPAIKQAGLQLLSLPGTQRTKEKVGTWLRALLDESDPALRLDIIAAIENNPFPEAASRLCQWLNEADRPLAERTAIVRALRTVRSPEQDMVTKVTTALKTLLFPQNEVATPEAVALRREALQTLEMIDRKSAEEASLSLLSKEDPTLQHHAVQLLGSTPQGARQMGQMFLEKKLPRELLPQVAEALRKHIQDESLAKMHRAILRSGLPLSTDKAEIERVRQMVRQRGSAERGKDLYLNSKTLACITCHRLEGVGGQVGPDLTRLWDTHSIEKIMEAIIEPSKEIKEGYQAFQATTQKGAIYQGLKIAQSATEVVLRDSNGKDIRLAMKNIDELVPLKQSLMPEGVASQLTYNQFIDLVAFLTDREAQESLRGIVLEYFVVGPFGDDLSKEYPPETKTDPSASYPGVKPGEMLRWQPRQADMTGHLNLRAIFNQDHISAYALTYLHAQQAQDVDMQVSSNDTLRAWLNGVMVHERDQVRAAQPGADKVRVRLKQGWNMVLIKVVNIKHNHGLYLRFAGGSGLRSARQQEN